jgi:hypothetical protein
LGCRNEGGKAGQRQNGEVVRQEEAKVEEQLHVAQALAVRYEDLQIALWPRLDKVVCSGGWWAGGEQDLLVCCVRFVGVDRQGLSLLVVDLPAVLTITRPSPPTITAINVNKCKDNTNEKRQTKNEEQRAKNETHMSLLTVCEWLYMSAQGTMPYEPNPTM